MFFKGDRVLYRNTHFGTVHEIQTMPTAETVEVKFDNPRIASGKVQTVRIDDLEKVRDAAHEAELSLQTNKTAPNREDWDKPVPATVRLANIDIVRNGRYGEGDDIKLNLYDRDDKLVAVVQNDPIEMQEFALRLLQQTTYALDKRR